ncbi:MAG: hypothetical protein LBT00_09485 [Spirochaetaceae bacterium]|nr:hypothetical protein [Spirochaetaceae bacterium]
MKPLGGPRRGFPWACREENGPRPPFGRRTPLVWITSPTATVLPLVRNDGESCHCERATRHCERSEAIQWEGMPRLDCFVASLLAMTMVLASLRGGAKQSKENAPRLDCFTNGKLPQVRNDGGPLAQQHPPRGVLCGAGTGKP